MKPLPIIILLFVISFQVSAQSLLDNYIKEGLEHNQALKQQQFYLDKAMAALKEANGLFMPNLDLRTDYVDSRGGRTIDIPIGDLLNPVYQNLNQINAALSPGSPEYPKLDNVSEQLNPKNFYNAYLRASMPLVNAEVWYNRKIKKHQINLQQSEIDIYKRELVKEIKIAYYNYLKATQAVRIYEAALVLVKESQRVNQKLVENGKEVQYALSRSKSEVSKIEAELTNAKNSQANSAAYFNFLLNKPLDAPVEVDQQLLEGLQLLPSETSLSSEKREELRKLMTAKSLNESVLKMSRSAWIPKLGIQFDLGSQGFDFEWNSNTNYYLLGVSFNMPLFAGMRNLSKISQTQFELKALDAQTQYVEGQLKLAATTANNSYQAATEQYAKSVDQENAASQYFNLMDKKYREGMALYIEFLDARNEKTLSSLQRSLKYFDAWIKLAELERANASFNIN
ncbi:MAG: TolC family protein [Chitinophagales bacterium]|nr:TolC family protein [Chitinophagales bacterium]